MQGGSHSLPLGSRITRPIRAFYRTTTKAIAAHPFLIKTVSSGFGFAFGDVLFQLGTTRRKGLPMDWRRSAAMGGAGLAVAGPVGYCFIMWMEGNIMTASPHSPLALGVKLTLDQVLGFAIWHAALAAINEPYRQGFLEFAQPTLVPAEQQQQQGRGRQRQLPKAGKAQ